MRTKNLTNVKLVKDDAGELTGAVTAVFATLGVKDSDGDVIMPGAIDDGAAVVISAYGHGSWNGALPVGRGVIREDDDVAVLDGKFLMDTTHGSDTFKTVAALSAAEDGADGLQEWSFSLEDVVASVERYTLDGDDDDVASYISSVKIKEVSPVIRGAGVGTRTLDVKQRFTDEADAVLAAVDRLHQRASDVVTLRAEKGKTIGDDAAAALRRVTAKAGDIARLLDAAEAPPAPANDHDVTVANELARFVQITQGARS